MTAAFKTPLPSTQKFVLVALCDCANDQGECYPSIKTLMEKCSLSERAVQESIHELESSGYVEREFRTGRSTTYWICTAPANSSDPRSRRTPALGAPPHVAHPTPARSAPPPPHLAHPTPAPGAPITIREPSIEPSGKQKRRPSVVAVGVLVEAGFSPEVAAEFIAHKSARDAPLTDRAWADHVREAGKAGWGVVAAAEKVMAKNWKGFEAKYVANESPPQASKQTALEARNAAMVQRLLEKQSAA